MSGIVLSASVRQNLLSLQSTADLLATTQNRLSTGKKVNSALDNPTNFFTAQGLDNRASDISNLLDGIGNGVQVLQAANTGITSLQSLVDTAKSIANQALQTTVGYSTKSNVSTTIAGATSSDLRGTTTFTSAIGDQQRRCQRHRRRRFPGHVSDHARRHCGHALVGTAGDDGAGTATKLCGHHRCSALPGDRPLPRPARHRQDGDVLIVNGKTITFKAGAAPARRRFPPAPASAATSSPTATATPASTSAPRLRPCATVGDVLKAIDLASGVAKTVNIAGAATITGSTASITAGRRAHPELPRPAPISASPARPTSSRRSV